MWHTCTGCVRACRVGFQVELFARSRALNAMIASIRHWAFIYEMWTGVYMMDPWEKVVFNSLVAATAGVAIYSSYRTLEPVFA